MTKTFKINCRRAQIPGKSPKPKLPPFTPNTLPLEPYAEVESTFSGGNSDFAVYDAAEPFTAYSTTYFSIVKNA